MGQPINPFDSCWARVDRMRSHQVQLATIWNEYLDTQPFLTTFSKDDHGDYLLQVNLQKLLPIEFSIQFGEWLYNARSCLDNIVWAATACIEGVAPPTNDNHLSFPITSDRSHWRSWKSKHQHLTDRQLARLLKVQLFESDPDANYLGVINELAKLDRHRRLNFGAAVISNFNPIIEAPQDSNVSIKLNQCVISSLINDVALVRISPQVQDLEPRINPNSIIDPEILEWRKFKFWNSIRFSDRLLRIETFIAAEIALFEYESLGNSRGEKYLTETYKQDLEEHGFHALPMLSSDNATNWSDWKVAEATSHNHFQNGDPTSFDPATFNPSREW